MPESVFGLPIHPLVVHATVVVVPLAAAVLALAVTSARFRAWAGWLPLGLAVVSVALVPITTASGDRFEELLGIAPEVIERHRELGELLVWWCLGMLAVAAASTVAHRRSEPPSRPLSRGLAVAGVAVAVGTIVMVVLIGHSGADAAWGGVVTTR